MRNLLLVASLAVLGGCFAPDGWWEIEPRPAWRVWHAQLVECAGADAQRTDFDRISFRATLDLPEGVIGSRIGDVVYVDATVLGERAPELVWSVWLGEGAELTLEQYTVAHEMLHVIVGRRGHHYPFGYCSHASR